MLISGKELEYNFWVGVSALARSNDDEADTGATDRRGTDRGNQIVGERDAQ